jgi:hypothetical protein
MVVDSRVAYSRLVVATFSLAARHHQERVTAARVQARIAHEVGDDVDPHPNARMKLPGDPAALRGLPAVGVRGGYGGAMKGTRPDVRW